MSKGQIKAGVVAVGALLAIIAVFNVIEIGLVEPGYMGIKVNLMGDDRGVDEMEVVVGRFIYNQISHKIVSFPTFQQTSTWDGITFNATKGIVLTANVGLIWSVNPGSVGDIYTRFRKSAHYIGEVFLRQKVRSALNTVAGGMDPIDILGSHKAALLDSALAILRRELEPEGFVINDLTFLAALGAPPRTRESIDRVVEAKNRASEAENKIAQAKAEATQKYETARGDSLQQVTAAHAAATAILARARAQAEGNRLLARSLTPSLVALKRIEKWKGDVPQLVGAQGSLPMITLPAR